MKGEWSAVVSECARAIKAKRNQTMWQQLLKWRHTASNIDYRLRIIRASPIGVGKSQIIAFDSGWANFIAVVSGSFVFRLHTDVVPYVDGVQ